MMILNEKAEYHRGFTLIELLVVIAIIGIFVGIVVVFLSGARSSANVAAFKSETDTLVPAAISYCDGRTSADSYAYPQGSTIMAGSIACDDFGQIATTIITDTKSLGCTATISTTGNSVSGC